MLKELIKRRELLVARSAQQREQLRGAVLTAADRLSLVDSASSWMRRLRWRSVFATGTLLASIFAGSRRARGSFSWLARAGAIYSAFRQARTLVGALRQASGSRPE